MHQVLLVTQVLVAVALVALVLLQQGKGADAGASFGGGSSGSLFGSRGPASFLAKFTALMAVLFFANSLALGYISGQSVERRSVVERFEAPAGGIPAPDANTLQPGVQDIPSAPAGDAASRSDVPSAPASQ